MRHPVCKVCFPNYSLAGKLFIANILIAAAGVTGSVPHRNTFVLFGFRVCKVWAIQVGPFSTRRAQAIGMYVARL